MIIWGLFGWRLPESNWGHTDFQSVALPTELKRRFLAEKIGIKDNTFCIKSQYFFS